MARTGKKRNRSSLWLRKGVAMSACVYAGSLFRSVRSAAWFALLCVLSTGLPRLAGAQAKAQEFVITTTLSGTPLWGVNIVEGDIYLVESGNPCTPGAGCGAVHQITLHPFGQPGVESLWHTFNASLAEGAVLGNLVEGPDGNFWGTTGLGGPGGTGGCIYTAAAGTDGCGTFFNGELTVQSDGITDLTKVLHGFTYREGGQGGLITLGSDGNYYGVSSQALPFGSAGNSSSFAYSAYQLTPTGDFTKLAVFLLDDPNDPNLVPGNLNGGIPYQLLEADDGNLYGVSGRSSDSRNPRSGAFFRITKEGVTTLLANFPYFDINIPLSTQPFGQLVEGPDQALYGVTGPGLCEMNYTQCGVVFRVTKSGTLSILHQFAPADGYNPLAGLMLGADGVLYGTNYNGGDITKCVTTYAAGCGTVYSLNLDGSNFQVLHTFEGGADGAHPNNITVATFPSLQDTNGNLVTPSKPGVIVGAAGNDGQAGSPSGVFYGIIPPAGPLPDAVQVQIFKASDMSPVPANGVPTGTPLVVQWQVLNAFSNTMQACQAHTAHQPDVQLPGWTGMQKGTLSGNIYRGQSNVTIASPGDFRLNLNCGGVELGGAHVTTFDNVAITTATLPNASVNQSYSLTLAATGGTAPYTYALTSGSLPVGITLDAKSGSISGKATQFGKSSFTVQVTDSSSTPQINTASFTLTVDGSLAITTAALPAAHLNQAYSQTIVATGGVTPYTYAVSAGSLPAGLMLDTAKGVLSGTPTKAGNYNFTIAVSDAESTPDSKTQSYALVVAADTLTITTASLPAAGVGNAYAVPLNASGGVAPYIWTLVSGATPKGIVVDAGQIVGTPQQFGPGTPFTIQVADSETPAQTATATFTLPVKNTLAITTTALPSGTVGVPYSFQLGLTGGLAPYTWTPGKNLSSLGLALDPATGILSGKPTVAGAFTGGISVQDSEGTPDETVVNVTLVINPAAPGITTTTISTGNANAAVGQQVTFTAQVNSAVTATGMVTFAAGTTVLGTAALNTGNVATFTTSFAAAGTYNVVASYAGDTYNAASVSAPLVETVVAPSVSATLSPGTLTVKSGASGTTTITITPTGGYTGTVTFSCGNLPQYVSCTFVPPSLTIAAGSGPVTDTLTIDTAAVKSMAAVTRRPGAASAIEASILLSTIAGIFLPFAGGRRRLLRQRGLLMAVLCLAGVAAISGCGSTPQRARPGTYTIPITLDLGNGATTTINTTVSIP